MEDVLWMILSEELFKINDSIVNFFVCLFWKRNDLFIKTVPFYLKFFRIERNLHDKSYVRTKKHC